MFRRRRGPARARELERQVESGEPLDEAEQEAFVRLLEAEHRRQQRLWRGTLGALAAAGAGFLCWSAREEIAMPSGLRWHAELKAGLGRSGAAVASVVGLDLTGAAALALAAAGQALGLPSARARPAAARRLLAASAALACLALVAWAWARPDRLSLPSALVPALGPCTCLAIFLSDRGFRATDRELAALRGLK